MNKTFKIVSLALALAGLGHTAQAGKFVYVSEIPGNIVNTSPSVLTGKICLINQDQRWTADKVYVVDKMVFVEEPAVLTIEPGTIVRFEANTVTGGTSTSPNDPGALFICRGAKIVAQGTADAPIVMTNLDDPFVAGGATTIPTIANGGKGKEVAGVYQELTPRDYSTSASASTPRFQIDQEWGGLVMLGKAKLAFNTTGTLDNGSNISAPVIATSTAGVGANFIEGTAAIDSTIYGISPRAGYTFSGGLYGGANDNDNSGSLRFVSLRFGGFLFAPDNELNGLTSGALGRNTSIEFVEIYNNADDDFEPFGGRNDFRYIVGTAGGDDGFDIDQGYNGNVQFMLQLQGNVYFQDGTTTGRPIKNQGDILGEWDGPEKVKNGKPYSVPTVFNYTGIGGGYDGIDRKDNAGGKVFNSVYVNPSDLTLVDGDLEDAVAGTDGTGAIHRFLNLRPTGGEFNNVGDSATPTEEDLLFRSTTFAVRSSLKVMAGSETNNATVVSKLTSNTGYQLLVGLTNAVRSLPVTTVNTLLDGGKTNSVGSPVITPASLVSYYGSLDPRTGDAVSAGVRPSQTTGGEGYARKSGWFVETDFRGAFKDGNWLSGWSVLEDVGVAPQGGFATAAFPVPTVSRVVTGNIARVTFPTANGVKYSVQASEDGGKTYLPVNSATGLTDGVVVGNGNSATVDLAGKGSTQIFVRVMAL
jgi:plastocyanin